MVDDAGRVRVLWLAKGLGQGGMERLLVTHACFGDRDRFDYLAAYLVDRPHSVIGELSGLGVAVTRLGNGSGRDPRWVLDLVRLVRSEGVDVVHAHSPMPAAVARPILRLACPRVRVVYTEHNRWDRYSTPTRWANMATFALNHRAFAVSEDCRASVSPRHRERIDTLVHGIDLDAVAAHRADRAGARAELGFDDDTVVVGTVANLRVQKNYPMLLEVAAKVTSEHRNVRFVAVGQGPLEAELDDLHARLGLGDRFRFLGFRADVLGVMSAFDVFCLSSDFEGLPVSLMEAKALGLPVVSTAVGGVTESITDGADGYLTPRGDAAALGDALVRVAQDPLVRERLGSGSAASSGRFDARSTVEALETTYRSLAESRRRRGV